MKISILIPTIKPESEIQNQVDAIHESMKGCPAEYEVIVQSAMLSAAINRNKLLEKSTGNYIIFVDDDIENYLKGWALELVKPLNDTIRIISAKLMNADGTPGTMISFRKKIDNSNVWLSDDCLLPTACMAMKRETWMAVRDSVIVPENIPFDENYIRANAEDSDICMAVKKVFPDMKVAVNNLVKVTHRNNEVWRTDNPEDWKQNHRLFRKKWGRDPN